MVRVPVHTIIGEYENRKREMEKEKKTGEENGDSDKSVREK